MKSIAQVTSIVTYLIYIILWDGTCLVGCSYLVFWQGHSMWLFALAVFMSSASFKPKSWYQLWNKAEDESEGDK